MLATLERIIRLFSLKVAKIALEIVFKLKRFSHKIPDCPPHPLRGTSHGYRARMRRGVDPCVKRFRGGIVFKAHRLVYHSPLGWRAIRKKKKKRGRGVRDPSCSAALWFRG